MSLGCDCGRFACCTFYTYHEALHIWSCLRAKHLKPGCPGPLDVCGFTGPHVSEPCTSEFLKRALIPKNSSVDQCVASIAVREDAGQLQLRAMCMCAYAMDF